MGAGSGDQVVIEQIWPMCTAVEETPLPSMILRPLKAYNAVSQREYMGFTVFFTSSVYSV